MPRSRTWTGEVARLWDRRIAGAARDERGSASLEFVTAGLILLVPLVYLVLAVSAIQGGALAIEGAARQAARVYVQAPSPSAAGERAERAVRFALADYGFVDGDASVSISCAQPAGGCLDRREDVTVVVRMRVVLPFVPDMLSLGELASVPIEATATQRVSRFWGAAS